MADSTKISPFHPALSISNIKNFIPVTLDMENVQYSSWAELFKITARAYQVLDHIVPPSATEKAKEASSKTETDKDLWDRLDAVVLQWIAPYLLIFFIQFLNPALRLSKHGIVSVMFSKIIEILVLSTWKINSHLLFFKIFLTVLHIVRS